MSFGSGTITSIGGAASDLFGSDSLRTKAAGDRLQAKNYDLASDLAAKNEQFTQTSTAIKLHQLDRNIFQTLGGQAADVAGAGFAASGSALDLMRDSAAEGALTHAVAQEQGMITGAGYHEQAESFTNMSAAARMAADAEDKAADRAWITAGIKGIAAVASVFTGGDIGGLASAAGGVADTMDIGR